MKSFSQIQEERGERAFKQAMSMGLKYGGFGYWKDPQTNETVYKTENDTLVKVEPREESELAAKGGPDDGGGRPGEMAGGLGGGAGGGGMTGAAGMLQMPGAGPAEVGGLGAGEPGAAKVAKEHGWEPGPDGDTCVGPEAEKPGEVPKDSFVGRTNFLDWKSGPDGDNMNTISFGDMREQIKQIQEGGRTDLGSDYVPPDTKQKEGIDKRKNARIKANMLFNKGVEPPEPIGPDTEKALRDRRNVVTQAPSQYQRGLNFMKKKGLAQTTTATSSWGMEYDEDEGPDLEDIHRDASAGAIKKDGDVVNQMNAATRSLVQDPEYAMDQFHDDLNGPDFLAGGAFGNAFKDNNGNIIKRGKIGPGEMAALHRMRENKAFPNLINAQFDSPFIQQSTAYNNPQEITKARRGAGEEDYWDPDDASEWDKRFPGAFGTYAMSEAKGGSLAETWPDMDADLQDKALRNFWRARGDLHKAGFSHNDMHGGNVMVDPETGEVNIIDLGLAQDNPMSALMEGLGGLDFEEGEDYQLAHQLGGSNFSERMREMSVENRSNIEEMIIDNLGDSEDYDDIDEVGYSPKRQNAVASLDDLMRGGIRMRNEDMDKLGENIPFLKDPENIKKIIKMLYDGIGNSELADRMGDAFERKQLDTKTLKAANLMRKQKGQSQITPRRDVIPPKNMDFDD